MKEYSMDPESIDIPACAMDFCHELRSGLRGEPSSLMMLPAYVSPDWGSIDGGSAIAIDAGGTHLRAALVTFTPNGPEITHRTQLPMPGTREPVTRQQFYNRLIELIEPLADLAECLGFCFSFPAEILPQGDARVIRFNKEINISESRDMLLCQPLMERFPNKTFMVLNDTVAAQLGSGQIADMGFILGTGTNICYTERAENIKDLPSCSGSMIINTESAGFDRFPMGEFERRVDDLSAIPGDHLFEKAVSGAYLGSVIYQGALQAAEDGLLTCGEQLRTLGGLTTAQADGFARDPDGCQLMGELSARDRQVIYHLTDLAMDRAARLITASLAGVMLQTGLGISAPALISVEGSTFHRSLLLRPKIEKYLHSYPGQQLGRSWRFVSGSNTNLTGAAAAALLKKQISGQGSGAR